MRNLKLVFLNLHQSTFVGAKKDRLNETVLLSIQNKFVKMMDKKIHYINKFINEWFRLSRPIVTMSLNVMAIDHLVVIYECISRQFDITSISFKKACHLSAHNKGGCWLLAECTEAIWKPVTVAFSNGSGKCHTNLIAISAREDVDELGVSF